MTGFASDSPRSPAFRPPVPGGQAIEHCEDLLQDRRLTIKQIADACGFCDEFHFAKRFKELTGLTPAQFRHRLM